MADFKFEDQEINNESPAPPKSAPPAPSKPVPPAAPKAPQTPTPQPPPAPVAPKLPTAPRAAAPQAPQAQKPAAPTPPRTAAPTPPRTVAPTAPRAAAPSKATPPVPSTPPSPPQAPQAPTVSSGQASGLPVMGARANVRRVLDVIDPYVEWIFRVAAIAGVLSLGFVLLITFSGNIAHLADNPHAADVLRNLTLASKVLGLSLILVALGVLILMHDDRTIGVGIGLGGLVLVFGVPWLMKAVIVGKSDVPATLAAAASVIVPLRNAGFVLTALGMLKGFMDLIFWFTELPSRMKQRADVGVAKKAEPAQQKIAARANMFSPCWQLPFCREVIRKQCPAFLAKKRCWKFGRGCYCDEEMIARIVRGESLDVIKAPTRMSRQGKPPCGRCYIYLEHQALKFKVLSPLAFPLTLLIVFFGWHYYEIAFGVFNKTFESVLGMISFDTSKLTPDAIKTTEHTTTSISNAEVVTATKYLFGILGGFFLLIYLSKFFEWVVFKAKL